MWKEEGGSAQDNVARRNTRAVTFSPDQDIDVGKRISYFSVQKPWIQQTFRGSSPGDKQLHSPPIDESVDSIYTTDESFLKRTFDTSVCDTSKATPTAKDKTDRTWGEDHSAEPQVSQEQGDVGFEVQIDESRDDDDDNTGDDDDVATNLKFSKGVIHDFSSQVDFKDSLGNDPSRVDFKDSMQGAPQVEFRDTLGELPGDVEVISPVVSPNRRMSMLTGDVYEPPTNLHDICFNAQSSHDLMAFQEFMPGSSPGRKKLKEVSTAASQRDAIGRTPLHLISQNQALSSSVYPTDDDSVPGVQPTSSVMTDTTCAEKKKVTTFVLDMLLAANPMAMKLHDANGHIPFQHALVEWIHIMHYVDSPKNQVWGIGFGSNRFSTSYSRLSAPSRIHYMLHSTTQQVSSAVAWAGKSFPFTSGSMKSMSENHSPKKSDDIEVGDDGGLLNVEHEQEPADVVSWALDHHPSHVQLTSHAKFAISLLSTILDHLEEYAPNKSIRRRNMMDRRSNGSNQTRDSFDFAMDEFRDFCFIESADIIAADIVQEIAAIPYLVKSMVSAIDRKQGLRCPGVVEVCH